MDEWKRLGAPLKTDLSWMRSLPRTRFLLDENFESNVIRAIRAAGFRFNTVVELGLRGRSDRQLFATSWRDKRMLVTYDHDFLNDHQFPLNQCGGLLVLPPLNTTLQFFWSIVNGPLRWFSYGGDLWLNTKIRVNRERQIFIRTWDREKGAIIQTHFWPRRSGWLWTGE